MILVLKKITCIIAVFVFAFMLVVSAAEDFLIYGKQTEEVSKVLGLKTQELDKYCTDNNVTYFAVNANNTKQVKRTEISDEFAQKVVDLSAWDDSKVLQLSSSLSGFEGAKGEVINKGDYKFLKVELQSEDSGGDYVLTQYTTVKNKERIVLTFFTSPGEDYGYIDKVFAEQFKETSDYTPIIIIGIVLFGFAGLVTLALIIKDFRTAKD